MNLWRRSAWLSSLLLNRKGYRNKSYPPKHEKKKNKERKLTCRGGQPETGKKYPKNEKFPQYQSQNIYTLEIEFINRSYQK